MENGSENTSNVAENIGSAVEATVAPAETASKVTEAAKATTGVPDYVTYPRTFATYRWWKPLLTGLLILIFFAIFSTGTIILSVTASLLSGGSINDLFAMTASGYDSMDTYTVPGAIASLGSVVSILFSVLLGGLVSHWIIKDRPVKSYSSSRGGWNFRVFFPSFAIALAVVGVPLFIDYFFIKGKNFDVKFTVAGFILCLILGPLQCVAEEYLFRGFLMQTIGSWVRIPVVAVIISVLLFAACHPYNILGVIEVACAGLFMCLMAWITNGLETSSAFHIVNNMTIFILTGFGFGAVQSEESIGEMLLSIAFGAVYVAIIFILKKKTKLFESVREDSKKTVALQSEAA